MSAPNQVPATLEQRPLRSLFPTQRNEWQLLLSIAAGYPSNRVGDESWQAKRLMTRYTSEFRQSRSAEYLKKINAPEFNSLKPGILYDVDVEIALEVEEWREQLFICSPSMIEQPYRLLSFAEFSVEDITVEDNLRNKAFIRLSKGEAVEPEQQTAEGGAE